MSTDPTECRFPGCARIPTSGGYCPTHAATPEGPTPHQLREMAAAVRAGMTTAAKDSTVGPMLDGAANEIERLRSPSPRIDSPGSSATTGADEGLRAKIEALRELSDEASPGPWQAYYTVHGDPYVRQAALGLLLGGAVTEAGPNDRADSTLVKASSGPDDYGHANAAFIAAAVNLARALLDGSGEQT